ncbi:acidic repeat-containing protein isoform X2 [Rhinatrema bivittatum]|nr:acidic repeat-containing protein isoform X2 [Rhinatrema bivittatum]
MDSPVLESRFQQLLLYDSDSHLSFIENVGSAQQDQQCTMKKTPNPTEQKSSCMALDTKEKVYENNKTQREKEKNETGWTQKYHQRPTVIILDSSDEEFEMFLAQLKTPKTVAGQIQTKQSNRLQDFFDSDDECFISSSITNENWIGKKKGLKDPLSQETSTTTENKHRSTQEGTAPVFTSESDNEDFIIKTTLSESCKDKLKRQQIDSDLKPGNLYSDSTGEQRECIDHKLHSYSHLDWKEKNFEKPSVVNNSKICDVQNYELQVPESSDDEFDILIERVKNRTRPQTPGSTAKKILQPRIVGRALENVNTPCGTVNSGVQETNKTFMPKPKSLPKREIASHQSLPKWSPKIRSVSYSQQTFSADQWSIRCQVPGCFLQELSNPVSPFVKNFKQKKEELTLRLYMLYNSSVFNQELPEKMEIIWNKNMRKTAGYCVTGQQREPGMLRYAKIELSEKVCDSADRLRDTLIHELCHAATWLINGVRDGHGQFWKFYAKKSTVVHPELPVVTQCHNYKINYKFNYKCSRCGTMTGRHSKSLDTQRFFCALCQGTFVLQSAYKDGKLTKTQRTPFAKFVKENHGSSVKEASGLSHSKLMRKLSAEFAAKTSTSDS